MGVLGAMEGCSAVVADEGGCVFWSSDRCCRAVGDVGFCKMGGAIVVEGVVLVVGVL